jgi:hypothetical protein
MEEMVIYTEFLLGSLKKKKPVGDKDKDGRILKKSEEKNVNMKTEWNWLRLGFSSVL